MMANEKYFLQMSECQWPDHVFIADAKTFRLCMYHKDPSKKAASLYCVTNDQDPYPVSIELLNNKGRVIRESKGNSNRYKKKLWSIISASTDFMIKHSFCEFSIKFDSLPPHYDQPLQFRFQCKSTNPKIPKIEPFTTREFRVVRYQLRILDEPPGVFYKDDGGMRNNHMTLRVALMNPMHGECGRGGSQKAATKTKLNVPLQCKLMTEDGKEIIGAMFKKGHQPPDHDEKHNGHSTSTSNGRRSKQKARPPLHYLQLHEDCQSPCISSVDGECTIKFRINDVSQNHKNQGFHVIIQPDIENSPHLCEVYECRSSKIIVKSKSPEKLNAQGGSKKRRSTRTRTKKKASTRHSVYDEDGDLMNGNGYHATRSRTRKRKGKSKRSRRQSDDEDYKPELSDNSDLDLMDDDHLRSHIKREHDVHNHLRKRRKLNGSEYVKTNGIECVVPRSFDCAPTDHWFPSMQPAPSKESNGKEGDDSCHGPEAQIQRFAQNCFDMLQFREWVTIGHQTKYIEQRGDEKCDSVKIVRCLLCDAEGAWSKHKVPRHKKECEFIALKQTFQAMKPHFIKLPKVSLSRKNENVPSSTNQKSSSSSCGSASAVAFSASSSSSSSPSTSGTVRPRRVPLPYSRHSGSGMRSKPDRTTISPPKMGHLPPLPHPHPPQHSRFMPPMPFPTHPFFAPPHGFFPVQPTYQIMPNQPPPPLMHVSPSNPSNVEVKHSTKLANGTVTKMEDGTKTRNGTKNTKSRSKIKSQDIHQRGNESVSGAKDDDAMNRKASPLMYPFGHQSPSMFPANVGPMQSPLFSSNLQTPQMFNAPLSGTNGSSNMFLGAANPNGQHSTHFHAMSSFSHTASTLPMPLQIPMASNGSSKSNGECNDSKNSMNDGGNGRNNGSPHRHRSSSPQSRAQSINPPVSTITAMSGISQDRNINADPVDRPHDASNGLDPHDQSNMSSVAATAGDGMTCNSNPMSSSTLLDPLSPFHSSPNGTLRSKSERRATVPTSVSVDSAILSQSASLSAVATAGGLTVNSAPAAHSKSATNSPRPPQSESGNAVESRSQSQMIAAHAPPLLPRYLHIMPPSMPALHPETTNTDSSPSPTSRSNDSTKPPPLPPLHERRLMENAPAALTIPSVTSNSAGSLLMNN